MKRAWTADDTATLRRMAQAGYSDSAIAAHLARPREVVCRHRLALGIKTAVSRAWLAAVARRRRMQFAA